MRGYREKCGCRIIGEAYESLCEHHAKEQKEFKARVSEEYRKSMERFEAMRGKEEKK